MDAVGVAQEGVDRRLVERHPVSHRVTQAVGHDVGEVGEPADDVRVGEAALVLERLRQVPVKEVDRGLDPGTLKLVPMLTAGSLGGTLQTGRVLEFPKSVGDQNRKLCSLYLSLMDRMGVKLDRFGDATTRLTQL